MIYNKSKTPYDALRMKWPFKKHTHSSIDSIYELRGHLKRRIKLWVNKYTHGTRLTLYNKSRRTAKRNTSRYE
jgi:hypothetical protein